MTDIQFDRYRLLAPGPVMIPRSVRQVMAQPMAHHRTPRFEQALQKCLIGLKQIFGTQSPVLIVNGTGSAAMEAAIVNTLSPGDEIITIVSGKFGERWSQIATAYGIQSHELVVEWGKTVDPMVLQKFIEEHKNAKAVLTQGTETSTGVLHPLAEISRVCQSKGCLLFVDAITTIGAIELSMDQLQIDVLVAGAQKAFMIPTGISFICLSPKAWQAYDTSRCPKFYFDLNNERQANAKGQTFVSSAVTHIFALEKALHYFSPTELTLQIERTQCLSRATHAAMHQFGLKIFAKTCSPALTPVMVPPSIDGEKLRQHIEDQYNITMMGGQDQLKGKIIRIGHLGAITNDDALAGIAAIALAINDLSADMISSTVIDNALAAAKNELTKDRFSEDPGY